MKQFLANCSALQALLIGLGLGFLIVGTAQTFQGCTMGQQRLAFNSIATVETATTAAVDGYFTLVAQGKVPTNGVPAVAKDFNKFQGGVLVALDLVQNNTNAMAPASLQQLSTDLINEIGQFKGGH